MRISLFHKDNFLNSGDTLNKTDQVWNEGKTLCEECSKEKKIGKMREGWGTLFALGGPPQGPI